MIHRNVGSVVFNADPKAIVYTTTPPTVSAFWHQRTRWASKRGRYEDSSILLKLILVYSFFLVSLVASAVAVVEPLLIIPVLGVLLLKATMEFLILSKGARLFRHEIPLFEFVIAELFHVPYIAMAGLVGQFTSLRWKDRNFAQ
jgi:cellulose synthase/poly-beta-1,6-N-acetylglucosamine synthase-like glycosyltransferase